MAESTRAQLQTLIESNLPDNLNNEITAALLRAVELAINESLVNRQDDLGTDNGKVPTRPGDKELSANVIVKVDGSNVTIESITFAAGVATAATFTATTDVKSNTINERTSATGVTIDGVLLKDGEVTTDTIKEKTSTAGVTIDGLKIKDAGFSLGSDAEGDVYFRNSAGALVRLAKGSHGNPLIAGATTPRYRTGARRYTANRNLVANDVNDLLITFDGSGSGLQFTIDEQTTTAIPAGVYIDIFNEDGSAALEIKPNGAVVIKNKANSLIPPNGYARLVRIINDVWMLGGDVV
jgi:hypothetical protein